LHTPTWMPNFADYIFVFADRKLTNNLKNLVEGFQYEVHLYSVRIGEMQSAVCISLYVVYFYCA
jgi:hypothetical protein